MAEVVPIRRASKAARTQMDTVIVNSQVLKEWHNPPFQRPLRINDKVRQISEGLKEDGGMIPGVITLGVIEKGKPWAGTYLLDGQHRVEAFRISELEEGLADVRICHFSTMAEMGEMFVELNSKIVSMRPDDVLRGLEGSLEVLRFIRRSCEFVGYDNIRRGQSAPILSMSQVLRAWEFSRGETPGGGGASALHLANDLTHDSAKQLTAFLALADKAWGRQIEYARLWGALNLTMCMWLYRQLVLDTERRIRRSIVLKTEQFCKCLMSLSADGDYIDWLQGRLMRERDRAPCYSKIKTIFIRRIKDDTNEKAHLPSPAWDTRGK